MYARTIGKTDFCHIGIPNLDVVEEAGSARLHLLDYRCIFADGLVEGNLSTRLVVVENVLIDGIGATAKEGGAQ